MALEQMLNLLFGIQIDWTITNSMVPILYKLVTVNV